MSEATEVPSEQASVDQAPGGAEPAAMTASGEAEAKPSADPTALDLDPVSVSVSVPVPAPEPAVASVDPAPEPAVASVDPVPAPDLDPSPAAASLDPVPVPVPVPAPAVASVDPDPTPAPLPPPAIETIEPSHGPLAGGTAIVIDGSGFAENCKVHIGGELAAHERESDARLCATTPRAASAGEAAVVVTNPDGQTVERVAGFRFDPPPALVGVEPSTVSVKGGTVVTLIGNDFAEGCSVLIDGASVPVARAHRGRLEAVVSPHATGAVDVAVKNPDGQRISLEGALRYADPPFLAGLSPSRSFTTGGVEVVLGGRFFEPGCAVLFAGKPLDEVRFISETELRVIAPGHGEAESIDVTVVSPGGLAHRVPLAFAYEKAPPRVISVSPAFGPNAGGTRLTITGTDLDACCAVFVCGIAATVTWKSREEIEVVTPPVARDGLVDVRVVNQDDQAAVAEKAFRYDAPLAPCTLGAITPTQGSQVGGARVMLTGEDFAEGIKVRFGGVAAEARFITRKQIEAVSPAYAGAGAVAVEVENPDGVTSTLESAFTYEARPAPAITSVSPPSGPTTGATRLVIEGQNFTKDCLVYVGREYPKDLLIKSATEIQVVTMPRKTPGVVDVEVAAPGLPRAVAKNAFRYDAVPAPIITSISPNVGAVAGGTEMTIEGKNFRKDTVVLIDGKPPRTVKFIDDKTLEFKTPPGDANKMVDVIVRNLDGKEAVQKRAFMYDPRYR